MKIFLKMELELNQQLDDPLEDVKRPFLSIKKKLEITLKIFKKWRVKC
ncbi:MAG: hypothetical protein ACI8RA_002608 [Chlamydiales bacterium]|jgi:hypothetical protein